MSHDKEGTMQARQPDTRTVPPIESEDQWESLVETIATNGDAIVESKSGTKVAVISYEEFIAYQAQRKQARIDEAYAQLMEALKGQDERNADLSDEDVEALAERASRESFDELVAEGKLIFERDQK